MSTTRREFVKGVAVGTAGLAVVGSLRGLAAIDDSKYGHYCHPFYYRVGQSGPGDADYFVHMDRNVLNGTNTNFTFGYYSKVGAWNAKETEAKMHPYDTCLVFAGLEPKDPNYLGAEVEISLGKEYEKHVISVPSIVCIPKDFPYGPIETKKVEKPFAHYAIGLDGDYAATKLSGKPAAASSGSQYAHLIKKMSATGQPGANKIGPGNADWLSWPKSKDLEGFIVNFTWGFYSGLGNWHNIPGFDPHVHIGDEFLVFVSLDAMNPYELGAVIEQHLGEEEEIHRVTLPQVIVCPEMFTHAPVYTKKVDRTYGFFLIRRDTGEFYSPGKTPAKKPAKQ
jgi:hypothetical protein